MASCREVVLPVFRPRSVTPQFHESLFCFPFSSRFIPSCAVRSAVFDQSFHFKRFDVRAKHGIKCVCGYLLEEKIFTKGFYFTTNTMHVPFLLNTGGGGGEGISSTICYGDNCTWPLFLYVLPRGLRKPSQYVQLYCELDLQKKIR